jgi:hypothetical protein
VVENKFLVRIVGKSNLSNKAELCLLVMED